MVSVSNGILERWRKVTWERPDPWAYLGRAKGRREHSKWLTSGKEKLSSLNFRYSVYLSVSRPGALSRTVGILSI